MEDYYSRRKLDSFSCMVLTSRHLIYCQAACGWGEIVVILASLSPTQSEEYMKDCGSLGLHQTEEVCMEPNSVYLRKKGLYYRVDCLHFSQEA